MNLNKETIIQVLRQSNLWWRHERDAETLLMSRAVLEAVMAWVIQSVAAQRLLCVHGARGIGKSTLLKQCVARLLQTGVPPEYVMYVNLDLSVLRFAGLDAVLQAGRYQDAAAQVQYLLLDELQLWSIDEVLPKLHAWLDQDKTRRVICTASIRLPAFDTPTFKTLHMHGLSLTEYLAAQQAAHDLAPLPALPAMKSLFKWSNDAFEQVTAQAAAYEPHFYNYLQRGGFYRTQAALSLAQAQEMMRAVIDKLLKQDTSQFARTRHLAELERIFLYLCEQKTTPLDVLDLCSQLQIKRPTVSAYLELLTALHLVTPLSAQTDSNDVQRERRHLYLADAAMASAMLMKGNTLLEDADALAVATETAVFQHWVAQFSNVQKWYYRSLAKEERVWLMNIESQTKPLTVAFGIHCHASPVNESKLKTLLKACQHHQVKRAYVITKDLDDIGPLVIHKRRKNATLPDVELMRIPALLFCYWIALQMVNTTTQRSSHDTKTPATQSV